MKMGLHMMETPRPVLYMIVGVLAITTILLVPVTNAYSTSPQNSSFTDNNNNNASKTSLLLNTVSQRLNNTISNLMGIAEASMNRSNSFGKLPQAKLTSDMKLKFHGIPSDQELEKRIEAKRLLANNKALLYVGLLLPNGDRYFGEPYSPYQTNSSVTNFASRDHFIGALKTKQPYLSSVFKAVTTGEPLAILASPIYTDVKNHESLIGVQVLGLNFSYFNDMIKSIMPTVTESSNIRRIVLVDNNGTGIADSSFSNNNNKNIESFKNLQSFQNAKNETGSLTENVDGKKMSISYMPIKFAQSKWIALLFSSND
jgi:Cache domain